ncbi:MAG: hypothetical protein JNL98_34325 [Bryobacterales bacterium]|nr:hypothetical protein [Bryobacterales bacterium]
MLAGTFAALLVFSWQSLLVSRVHNGNPTILFCTGSTVEVPADAAAGLARSSDARGYDGQFYRLIARDPVFARGWQRYVDDPRLRYRRILVPSAAFVLALGQDAWIDGAYVACILFSIFLGVYWTGRWFTRQGRSGALGLTFLLVPATLTSMDRMLVDGPLCALFAGYALRIAEKRPAWGIVTCAPLVRETGVFLAIASFHAEIRLGNWRRALIVGLTQIPALCWFAFVQANTPPSGASEIFSRPAIGQIERLLSPRSYPFPRASELLFQTVDVLAVGSLIASVAFGIWLLVRLKGTLFTCCGLFALLGIALGGSTHLAEAYGFSRPVSPLLLVLLMQGLLKRNWAMVLAPLGMTLAVSLSIAYQAVLVLRTL